ncbi:hypothetical protein MOF73_004645 [Salmonella enterica]|nr:hypothetical protein [Salmonella enterica]
MFDDQVVLPSLESVLTGISSSQRCDDRTTAAWRLQIVVWQNMSFQSNHPE